MRVKCDEKKRSSGWCLFLWYGVRLKNLPSICGPQHLMKLKATKRHHRCATISLWFGCVGFFYRTNCTLNRWIWCCRCAKACYPASFRYKWQTFWNVISILVDLVWQRKEQGKQQQQQQQHATNRQIDEAYVNIAKAKIHNIMPITMLLRKFNFVNFLLCCAMKFWHQIFPSIEVWCSRFCAVARHIRAGGEQNE